MSLFAFDIIMALGRVVDIKWIREAKVYVGGFCTAQGKSDYFHTILVWESSNATGVIQQLGETGSALATLVSMLACCRNCVELS